MNVSAWLIEVIMNKYRICEQKPDTKGLNLSLQACSYFILHNTNKTRINILTLNNITNKYKNITNKYIIYFTVFSVWYEHVCVWNNSLSLFYLSRSHFFQIFFNSCRECFRILRNVWKQVFWILIVVSIAITNDSMAIVTLVNFTESSRYTFTTGNTI